MAPPPEPATASPRLRRRLGARLVDALILVAAGLLVLFVVAVVGLLTTGDASAGVAAGADDGVSIAVGLLQSAIWLGYYVLFETTRGQTPGKMILAMRVVDQSGGRPTAVASLKRNAFLLVGLVTVLPYIGFLGGFAQLAAAFAIASTVVRDPEGRGWHDTWGGTKVVEVE